MIFRNFPGIVKSIVKLIIKYIKTFKNFWSRLPLLRRRGPGRRRGRQARRPKRGSAWLRLLWWRRTAVWGAGIGLLLGLVGWLVWWRREPAPPSAAVLDRRPLVVIDAGHGGVDGGTQGFGVLEKRVALATALATARELRQRGVRTVLTRETDVGLSLDERIAFANGHEAAALVSVHFNFTTASPAVRGVETYFSDPKDLSAQAAVAAILRVPVDHAAVAAASTSLADAIRSGICQRADTPDRGTRNRPELAVTRRTRCPSVLVECAYLSNRADAARAATPEWQASLAQGIADGVQAWLKRSGP
jgi:N-acetylmuramoyl-L-alanine amidase